MADRIKRREKCDPQSSLNNRKSHFTFDLATFWSLCNSLHDCLVTKL